MRGVAGLHGQHVVLLVAQEQKPELEPSQLTRQMEELLAAVIVLKQVNYHVELVPLVRQYTLVQI